MAKKAAKRATKKVKAKKQPARKVARKVARKTATRSKEVKCTRSQAATARKVQAATKLYKAFHGEAPKRITRHKVPQERAGMVLGKLEAVIYETPDGKRYMHEFRNPSRPTLAASHDGRRVFVQGGRYRMTARGIVDTRK